LVAWGLVTADSFAGLRALLVPSDRRRPVAGFRRRGKVAPFRGRDGGTVVTGAEPGPPPRGAGRRSRGVAAAAALRRRVPAAGDARDAARPVARFPARVPPARSAG